jgi:hypothetical protein
MQTVSSMRGFATTKKDSSENASPASASMGTGTGSGPGTTVAPSPTNRDTKDDKDIPIEAHFKNPIVATLWAARQEAKLRLGLSDDSRGGGSNTTDVTKAAAQVMAAGKPNETTTSTAPPDALPLAKTSAESQTEISYSFSTDQILKEAYQNPWGEMRFGKVSAVQVCVLGIYVPSDYVEVMSVSMHRTYYDSIFLVSTIAAVWYFMALSFVLLPCAIAWSHHA